MPPHAEILAVVEERVRSFSTHVAASEQDFDGLYPDTPLTEVAARWAGRAPREAEVDKVLGRG